MEIGLWWKGLLIGFALAASIGPVSLLCMQRTLRRGWVYGFISGLGAALADGIFGLLGGLSLVAVTQYLVQSQSFLQFFGSMILIFLGIRITFSGPAKPMQEGQESVKDYLGAFSSILLITMANPITILFFASIYTGFDLTEIDGKIITAVIFAAMVFFGSAIWWLILALGIDRLRGRFRPQMLSWVNRVTGTAIALFGGYRLWECIS